MQQTVPAQEQEPRDEPRSAPARAAETIKRAITSLFGGGADVRTAKNQGSANKTKEAKVAAVPDSPGVPAPGRGSAPADVDPGAAPTFDIVRIEPRGRAVMAGRATPGARSRSGAAIG